MAEKRGVRSSRKERSNRKGAAKNTGFTVTLKYRREEEKT